MDKQAVLEELKVALSHLSDVAQLADNPLAQTLTAETSSVSRGVQLRILLLELIESLKPSPQVPPTASEWRQYHILHDRYVLHRPLWEIEHKLTIGERQVRREHTRGIAILAEMLNTRIAATSDAPTKGASAEPAATPQEAIQRLTPVSRVFGLGQLVDEVVSFLAVAGKLRDSQITRAITPDDLTVCTDPGILRQLLTNLLLALVPTLLPTDPPLTLSARRVDDRVIVTVTLTNGDLEEEEESLAVCELLAHSLGTHLDTASSAEGVLSLSITFSLPMGTQLRKVLVIDDELAAIELFQTYVIGLDYQIIGETNAEQAVNRTLQILPDAIVMDVMMPAMDGWELLQRMRHTPQLRNIPIVVCSVLSEGELAAALGAAAFLKKPILRSQLLKVLGEVSSQDKRLTPSA